MLPTYTTSSFRLDVQRAVTVRTFRLLQYTGVIEFHTDHLEGAYTLYEAWR